MPFFIYTAKNEHHDKLKGKVEAQTLDQAAAILQNRALLVISLRPEKTTIFDELMGVVNAISQDEIVNFTRQLSTMVTAGLSLTESLDILLRQSKATMAKVIEDVLREVENGSAFWKALEKQGKVFSVIYIQLVKAGETAGILDEILERLADTMEKQKEFRAKTKGALIYPIIVFVAMIGIVTLMMVVVVPKLTAMYKDLGTTLPLPTQILIHISDFFVSDWWILLGMIVIGGVAFRSWVRTSKGHRDYDRIMLKVPIMGALREKILLTEFCQTTGLLLGAGIPLLQALDVMAGALDNIVYQDAVREASKQVEKGVPLSQTIGRFEIFPPILSQMIRVGEETGKMNEVLLKLATYFEAESEHAVKNLTTALEPIIMVVLGVVVGGLLLAIIMPIYNLSSSF
jgi:type IV pilus assembly protein PilC